METAQFTFSAGPKSGEWDTAIPGTVHVGYPGIGVVFSQPHGRKGNVLLPQKALRRMSAIRRKVQADKIEANGILWLKAIGGFLKVGQLRYARSAPRRPEIQHIQRVRMSQAAFEVFPGNRGDLSRQNGENSESGEKEAMQAGALVETWVNGVPDKLRVRSALVEKDFLPQLFRLLGENILGLSGEDQPSFVGNLGF